MFLCFWSGFGGELGRGLIVGCFGGRLVVSIKGYLFVFLVGFDFLSFINFKVIFVFIKLGVVGFRKRIVCLI